MLTATQSPVEVGANVLIEILETTLNNQLSKVVVNNLKNHTFHIRWTGNAPDDTPNGFVSIVTSSDPLNPTLYFGAESPIIANLSMLLNMTVPLGGTQGEALITVTGVYPCLYAEITGFSFANGTFQIRYIGSK